MRKKIVAAMTAFTLLLGACGGQEVGKQTEIPGQDAAEEIRWTLKETELPDADQALKEILLEGGNAPMELLSGMEGDTLYRVMRVYQDGLAEAGICIQRLEAPYTAWENTFLAGDEWVEGEPCYVSQAALGQDGSVHILMKGLTAEGDWHYYMAEWTAAGGHTVQKIPDEVLSEEFLSGIKGFYVDAANTSYFATAGGVQYFDETFAEKTEWMDTGSVWKITKAASDTGKLYLCGSSIEGTFRIWTMAGREPLLSSEDVFMGPLDTVIFAGEAEGFLCTSAGIWQFSLENKQIEELLLFHEQGYDVEKICGATLKEDGTLLMAAVVDGEILLFEKVKDENQQEKVELEFALTLPTPFLREAVVDFNKQSSDCRIVLREPEKGESFADFQTRIQMEVSSGGGPALLSSVMDMRDAAEKGFLRDLTEDFTEQKGEMLENVWALGEVDGVTYGISYNFGVNALVTSADIVGEKENWTPEEMMDCVSASRAEAAVGLTDSTGLFLIMTLYGGQEGKLIDWKQGKSNLNVGEAAEILAFAGEYEDMGTVEDVGIRLAEGKVLAGEVSITYLQQAQFWEALFQGREVYIGYPVEDGGNGNLVCADTILVNQACEYPEGAIAFLKYLLSEETQDKLARKACVLDMGSSGFPARAEALEQMFLYAEEEQEASPYMHNPASYGGFEYINEPLGAESTEKLRKLLLNARPAPEEVGIVGSILSEETPAYFSGQKTAQEVCDILQNKVQLYLDERR